jgi:sigma-B regulation protein RsbU (phosphoserine phosphatase)
MMMSNLQAAVKACASPRTSPRELCGQVNRVMCANLASQGFISFVYAVLDCSSRQLTYCNAGHNPPILAGGSLRRLSCGGGILGVTEQWAYEEEMLDLHAGDRLLMYTDGITENRNDSDEEFGDDRLIDLVRRFESTDAAALTDGVVGAASLFSHGHFQDDVTVVAVTLEQEESCARGSSS